MQAFLEIFDIYLLEAVINGILLGGVLALLALGLNLIFGVIDVTWICYAELVMIGMYGMYYLFAVYHVPYWVAAPLCILLVAGLGALLHFLVIEPLLSAAPINQLLANLRDKIRRIADVRVWFCNNHNRGCHRRLGLSAAVS